MRDLQDRARGRARPPRRLVGFAIGSETRAASWSEHALRTHGAATDLRPRATHGRDDAGLVARQACPMTRSVEDAMLVLHAISGPDAGDLAVCPVTWTSTPDATSRGSRWATSRVDGRRHRCRSPCAGAAGKAGTAKCPGVAARLALQLAQRHYLCRVGGGIRRTHAQPASRSAQSPVPDACPTPSASRASYRPWITCRRSLPAAGRAEVQRC